MKLSLILIFLSLNFAVADDFSAKSIRKTLSPYMKMLEVDKESLKKDKDKIDLGRMLFYDKRLSADSTISCNSCHDLKKYGTNGEYFLKMAEDDKIYRDVPSIYNLKNLTLFSWIGDEKTLNDKIRHSFKSKYEMNVADTDKLVKRLKGVKAYEAYFNKVFPDDSQALNFDNALTALEFFINGLITPSPVDEFLTGNDKALNEKQLKGAFYFDKRSCFSCHTGSGFGGQMVIKLGIIEPWPNQKDQGHYEASKNPAHKMTFRVSPLRNVAETAPYFHDRSAKKMWSAIRKMGRHELGQYIPVEEIVAIQEFLKSMTGKIPVDYIKEPTLP